ncbi:MAG: glycoside hydrolase family 95 protein, partial [Bacillota bacterium]|nr:glycoside hydrolase family 95 protein [Bacillota bacterium]
MENKLWYQKPATKWVEGLPIGNGRLAAMVVGNPHGERISLNHEWLWRRKYWDRYTEDRSDYLKKVRDLLFSGKFEEGTLLANEAWGGNGGVSGKPCRIDSYQPAGDFCFKLYKGKVKLFNGEASNYYRELNLDEAVARVSYEIDDVRINYEIIAHLIYDMIIIKISSENGRIGGSFWLQRVEDPECAISFAAEAPTIKMKGVFQEGMEFCVEASIKARGGKIWTEKGCRLEVADAEEILVFVDIGTSAKGDKVRRDLNTFCALNQDKGMDYIPENEHLRYIKPELEWKKILDAHIKEHARYYGKLRMELPFAQKCVPTDQRLLEYDVGNDPGLPLLYFNYGRYLLCASSYKGDLPANLQGKWNENINPPWECDYHLDINLQMNYWIAEPANLPDATEALFTYMESLVPFAKKAARDLYGCEGACFPLSADAWGRVTPEAYGWSVWTGAGAWLAQHMWWHYEYGQDIEFLRKRAYPFLKDVALFYESYLTEDCKGILQVIPSQSPENRFVG